ncbi:MULTISPECIES: TetR/AcrR family transcriptional regulator [Pantoea]|uniref:TetR/AcrR family transcriptional regulator n=1 Tax=Pantoea TaxID=53335 RepID=UPI002899CEC3|nr:MULTISPECIES: TetR/AcrR family transcriptional regulator [Pantoea]
MNNRTNSEKKTKGEATRERLLNVAAAEFASHGFYATKISGIVKLSGVTQPVFYSYFKSKEDAWETLVKEFDHRLEDLVVSMVIEATRPKEDVIASISESIKRFLLFFNQYHHLTMINLFQPPQDVENRNKLKRWIARNMVIEQERGFYSDDISVDAMASCYLGVLIQTFLEHPDHERMDDISRERAVFLAKGLT